MAAIWDLHSCFRIFITDLAAPAIGIWAFCWISLIAHELGHAAAGWLVKLPLAEIRIGGGRVRRISHWGGVKWVWHRIPLCGWVAPKEHGSRSQNFVFILGGPLVTGLLCALLFWLSGEQTLLAEPTLQRPLHLFALMELGTLATTLWPARYTMYGRAVENDGLLLWRTVFPPANSQVRRDATSALHSAMELFRQGKIADAIQLVRKTARECPEVDADAIECSIAQSLANAGRWEEASAIFRELISALGSGDPKRPQLVDEFASMVLFGNARAFFAECEPLLRAALQSRPTLLTLQGTLGGLLVELGREEEAIPLLSELHAKGENEIDLGITAAYLSVLAQRRGDLIEAAALAREATHLLPDHPLVSRLLAPVAEKEPQIPA